MQHMRMFLIAPFLLFVMAASFPATSRLFNSSLNLIFLTAGMLFVISGFAFYIYNFFIRKTPLVEQLPFTREKGSALWAVLGLVLMGAGILILNGSIQVNYLTLCYVMMALAPLFMAGIAHRLWKHKMIGQLVMIPGVILFIWAGFPWSKLDRDCYRLESLKEGPERKVLLSRLETQNLNAVWTAKLACLKGSGPACVPQKPQRMPAGFY